MIKTTNKDQNITKHVVKFLSNWFNSICKFKKNDIMWLVKLFGLVISFLQLAIMICGSLPTITSFSFSVILCITDCISMIQSMSMHPHQQIPLNHNEILPPHPIIFSSKSGQSQLSLSVAASSDHFLFLQNCCLTCCRFHDVTQV